MRANNKRISLENLREEEIHTLDLRVIIRFFVF